MSSAVVSTIVCRAHPSGAGWLVGTLQAAALWPHGAWMAARVQDGSDAPLGLAALAALLMLLGLRHHIAAHRAAHRLAGRGRGAHAAVQRRVADRAAAGLRAARRAGAGAALMAWLPADAPRTALAGLVLLALPWIASLQYYGGLPLRVITAQASAWLLQSPASLPSAAARPCWCRAAGDRRRALLGRYRWPWMAWFCACAVAEAARALRDGVFLRRLPWIGAIVLAGNVLRNSLLVALRRARKFSPLRCTKASV